MIKAHFPYIQLLTPLEHYRKKDEPTFKTNLRKFSLSFYSYYNDENFSLFYKEKYDTNFSFEVGECKKLNFK